MLSLGVTCSPLLWAVGSEIGHAVWATVYGFSHMHCVDVLDQNLPFVTAPGMLSACENTQASSGSWSFRYIHLILGEWYT